LHFFRQEKNNGHKKLIVNFKNLSTEKFVNHVHTHLGSIKEPCGSMTINGATTKSAEFYKTYSIKVFVFQGNGQGKLGGALKSD
jgi:hypothetical protein